MQLEFRFSLNQLYTSYDFGRGLVSTILLKVSRHEIMYFETLAARGEPCYQNCGKALIILLNTVLVIIMDTETTPYILIQ